MPKIVYPAVFYEQENGIGVVFPDLPGCVTVGSSLREAVLRAEEALSLHIEGMERDGEELPQPTVSIDDVEVDPETPSFGKLLIVAERSRSVKVTITMDETFLGKVDETAKRLGKTRSGLLAEGARRLMAE